MTTPTPTPCSIPECNADGTGEPCATHEEEQAHAAGEHEFCGVTCETAMPTEAMRNTLLAWASAGGASILAELERRTATVVLPLVAAERAAVQPAWEAAYDSATFTPHLIGYCNDREAAQGAALAWFRAHCETDDRLEWEPDPQMAVREWDQWFVLGRYDADSTALATDIVVRHRRADAEDGQP